MAGLGDTVAELLARTRSPSEGGGPDGLLRALSFSPNPGALQSWVYAPEALAPRSPLVVVLHGCGQSAAGYAGGAGWLDLADRYGFAVLCPEQTRQNNANLCFNWFEGADIERGSGEAASIAQMVRRALAEHDLDPRRVFVTGLSAGGAMTAVMLATYPELFAAGAIIAGLPYGAALGVGQAMGAMRRVPDLAAKAWGDKVRAASPSPGRWPRVAIWHGDADTTVAPAAAEALALQWCDVHGAPPSAAGSTTDGRRTHTVWTGRNGEAAVELHRIAGFGHGTPIAANGVDACGTSGPWILEAGVSSSHEIAHSWGLAERRRPDVGRDPSAKTAGGDAAASDARASPRTAVADTISRALRQAGLLR